MNIYSNQMIDSLFEEGMDLLTETMIEDAVNATFEQALETGELFDAFQNNIANDLLLQSRLKELNL